MSDTNVQLNQSAIDQVATDIADAVAGKNVYLDQGGNYYIATSAKNPGDSYLPYPTSGLVAAINSASSGKLSLTTAASVIQTFGNDNPSQYPPIVN